MVHIDKKGIRHLAKLCRIACTEQQEDALLHDMQKILHYVEQLKELNTEGVEPCNFVTESMQKTPLRKDVVMPSMSRKEFLDNTPQHVGGMVKVPPVLTNS
jgi:aspartyl-tRNA(Asn)/glutamyl-tRNA(Gln) amidotransferase subunit C